MYNYGYHTSRLWRHSPVFWGLVPLFSWQIPLFALLNQKSFITGVQTLLYVRQETMTFGVTSKKKKKVKSCLDARFLQFLV